MLNVDHIQKKLRLCHNSDKACRGVFTSCHKVVKGSLSKGTVFSYTILFYFFIKSILKEKSVFYLFVENEGFLIKKSFQVVTNNCCNHKFFNPMQLYEEEHL